MSGDNSTSRVLNQDEIDSLLGFREAADGLRERSGIEAIIDSGMVSYERLPMLEVVFDRLVRMMSTSLRNFTSDNVEVSLDNITSSRFGDYLNSIPLPAMLAVFKAEEWDNYGLITVDSSLIYSIVDRSEEHTSELQSLMRNSYAVFCLKKKKHTTKQTNTYTKT